MRPLHISLTNGHADKGLSRRLAMRRSGQRLAALAQKPASNAADVTLAVGDGIEFQARRWSFGGDTSRHFDDHISRSVPGYADGHALIAEYSDFFVPARGKIVEVGCSVGRLVRLLATRHASAGVHVLGVDREPDMICRARAACADLANVELRVQDAEATDYTGADLVIMYYVMQFIPCEARAPLLARIRRGMRQGGALMLFEKVRFEDSGLQDIGIQIYTSYKLANGFRPNEIVAKAQSLRGVLTPLTSAQNKSMLSSSGFGALETIYRYLAFEGLVAIRPLDDCVDEMNGL